jgi:hypothetical protein
LPRVASPNIRAAAFLPIYLRTPRAKRRSRPPSPALAGESLPRLGRGGGVGALATDVADEPLPRPSKSELRSSRTRKGRNGGLFRTRSANATVRHGDGTSTSRSCTLFARSFVAFWRRGGSVGRLAAVMFLPSLGERLFAAGRQFSAVFFHALPEVTATGFDGTAQGFDVACAGALHRARLGHGERGNENADRDENTVPGRHEGLLVVWTAVSRSIDGAPACQKSRRGQMSKGGASMPHSACSQHRQRLEYCSPAETLSRYKFVSVSIPHLTCFTLDVARSWLVANRRRQWGHAGSITV